MAGAAKVLPPGGVLFLYGPYKEGGRHTAPSNEAFDASLRARNPEWGVRDLDEVKRARRRARLRLRRARGDAGQQSQRGVPPALIT